MKVAQWLLKPKKKKSPYTTHIVAQEVEWVVC